MTDEGRPGGRLIAAMLLGFVLHAAFASDMTVFGARPNVGLVVLLTAALFADAGQGAAMGFVLGLLEASYVSRFVGSFIVARSLTGFAIGALEERVFRDSVLVAVLVVAGGTFLSDACFFVFAPQPGAARWFGSALGTSAYNAVLAVPAFLAARRFLRVKES
jgi:rod shape-determining protein MreD